MKLKHLLVELGAMYDGYGDIDVLLSVESVDDNATFHGEPVIITAEVDHASEEPFVRIFGSDEE